MNELASKANALKLIKIDASNWRQFGMDDEYYIHSAILDLQIVEISELLPESFIIEFSKADLETNSSLEIINSSLYPNLFYSGKQ